MLPRWLAALGFIGLCTSFACFPPIAVVPIATTYEPTGATPRPSVAWSPSPSPLGTAAAYFPARTGTWRYQVTTTPAGGAAIAGERTLVIADLVTAGDTTTASATSTVKLNVPGFTALDQAAVKGQLTLTRARFSLTFPGSGTTEIPFNAAEGETWTENGLTAELATFTDTLTLASLAGTAFRDLMRIDYTGDAAREQLVSRVWFARGIGQVQRLDRFTHDGKAWESRAELIDHPGK